MYFTRIPTHHPTDYSAEVFLEVEAAACLLYSKATGRPIVPGFFDLI